MLKNELINEMSREDFEVLTLIFYLLNIFLYTYFLIKAVFTKTNKHIETLKFFLDYFISTHTLRSF